MYVDVLWEYLLNFALGHVGLSEIYYTVGSSFGSSSVCGCWTEWTDGAL